MIRRSVLILVLFLLPFNLLSCSAFFYVLETSDDLGKEREMLSKTNNWINVIPESEIEIGLGNNTKLRGKLLSADSLGIILEVEGENVRISKFDISDITVISKKSDRGKAFRIGLFMDFMVVMAFIMMSMGGNDSR
jgi:sRNA-binding regulator protein Hfq